MNICILSRTFHPAIGGLERMANLLACQFSSAGHRVEVVTDTPAAEGGRARMGYTITRTSSFVNRVRAFKRADVVLFMNISLHGLPAAWLSRRPIVASHHSCYRARGLRGSVLERSKRMLMRYVTNISCSEYVARQFKTRSVVIPNAFDRDLFRIGGSQPRTRDFVFCGRLVSDKGGDVCLRAFGQLVREVPDATLTIIGDGPERQALHREAFSLGIADSVQFAGSLTGERLVAALQQHVCMVVPSLWEEPFGIVALEGIACCDTIIVARRGGLPEAAGPCGLLAEPSVEEFFQAMMKVTVARRTGGALPGQISPERREYHLKKHAPDIVAERYLAVLRQVSAEKHV